MLQLKKQLAASIVMLLSFTLCTKSVIAETNYCPSNKDDPSSYDWNGTIPSGWSLGPLSSILPRHDTPYTLAGGIPVETYTFELATANPFTQELTCMYAHIGNAQSYQGATAMIVFIKNNVDTSLIIPSPYGSLEKWYIPPNSSPQTNSHPTLHCGSYTHTGAKVTDCAF